MNPLTKRNWLFRSATLLHSQSQRSPYNWTFWIIWPGILPPTSIRATHSCNLPCPCHMDSTHCPTCTSPIPCSNNGLVSHSLLAHRCMVFRNQIQLCLQDLSGGPAFLIGFSIVIVFLVVMGRHFFHSQTNLMSKVIKLLISWLEVGCQLKIFQVGFTLGRELRTWLFNMLKKIWHWLEMGSSQWMLPRDFEWSDKWYGRCSMNLGLRRGNWGTL